MQTPFELSSLFVDDLIRLDPEFATALGAPGHDHLWTDRSPEGRAQRHRRVKELVSDLAPHLEHPDRAQRLCAHVLTEYASHRIDSYEAGDHLLDLAHTASGFQGFREIFELVDHTDPGAVPGVVGRLESIGAALDGYRQTLELGMSIGEVVARRQVESALDQITDLTGTASAWDRLEVGSPDPDRVSTAIESAKVEMERFGGFLRDEYLPVAGESDGVGPERYIRAAGSQLGTVPDPAEIYEWGWGEIDRLLAEMRRVALDIDPLADLETVIERMESDPALSARSPAALVEFVSERQAQAIRDLDGSHFDVPDEIRRVAVMIAPPGGALGAYYQQPSEDFSRPGGIYYAIGDSSTFPLYQEVSTAYHEGFPGHHLQIGTSMANRQNLSRAHRLLVWYSGYGEGWAMYAERLMGELGYFERPEWVLGMLASQLFRAARVVTDIGLHLGLTIPDGAPVLGGEDWTFERACVFMADVGLQPHSYAVSDVKRYLGWPGQAITYKVGEREILELRESERRRLGSVFDLKDFHARVLGDGEMGFDLLRRVVSGDFDR